ncbi:MAG: hypothetical protein P8Y97_18670 [Candidatus Lokiarchaeota archaeon]
MNIVKLCITDKFTSYVVESQNMEDFLIDMSEEIIEEISFLGEDYSSIHSWIYYICDSLGPAL